MINWCRSGALINSINSIDIEERSYSLHLEFLITWAYNKTCKEDKEGEVRVCVSFLGPNHDYLIRDFDLFCCDDENTQFGFFTNNFYFVDRIIAAELYKKFAAKHNMPLREHLYSLNSYHIDWIRVEKESFRDYGLYNNDKNCFIKFYIHILFM